MAWLDAGDKERVALDVAGAHRQDLLVRRGPVPFPGLRHPWELDHDDRAGPTALHDLHRAAVHDEPSLVRVERGLDPLQVLQYIRMQRRVVQVGEGVCGHVSSSVSAAVAASVPMTAPHPAGRVDY